MWKRHSLSVTHVYLFDRSFALEDSLTKKLYKSAQNTETAKTHFYIFRNITEGSQRRACPEF